MSDLGVREVRKGAESAWVVAYDEGKFILFDTEGLYGPVGWDEDVRFAYRFRDRTRAERRVAELTERLLSSVGWELVEEEGE